MRIMPNTEPPDFEDMFALARKLEELLIKESKLDIEIKEKEAKVTVEMVSNEDYYIKGKPPSQTYIDSSYKMTGFNGEITKLRYDLGETRANIEKVKEFIKIMHDQISVYQTDSSNKRAGLL